MGVLIGHINNLVLSEALFSMNFLKYHRYFFQKTCFIKKKMCAHLCFSFFKIQQKR